MPVFQNTPQRPGARSGSSMIQPYLDEIQRIPLLTAQEEKKLAIRVSEGDVQARDLLIRSNLRLVVNTAKHYVGRGVGLEDLIEEGNLGLMRAVESFSPDATNRLSTYAVYWIKQSMRRAILNQGRLVRFPAYLVNILNKWNRAARILQEELGREPADEEVADMMGLSPKKRELVFIALQLLKAMPGRQSFYDDDERSQLNEVSDHHVQPVEDIIHEHDCIERIVRALEFLDELEADLIKMRFGLSDGESLGIQSAAQKLSITRDKARYVERRALERLRTISMKLKPASF